MKVLLAIDGSAHSEAAVLEVARRPWPAGTAVEIFTVIHPVGPMLPDPALVMAAIHVEQSAELRRRAPMLVSEGAEQLRRGVPDLSVITKIVEGVPKDLILQEAQEWGADLIVV